MKIDVIDQKTGEIVCVKDRKTVHTLGLWHVSVQANVVRLKEDSLEILVQKRSRVVDIAKNHFDQSCAVQAKSGEKNMVDCLFRGLKEELGIARENCRYFEFNSTGRFRIKKTYEYNPEIKNNEILHLFVVDYQGNEIRPRSKKVTSVEWIPWNIFVELSRGQDYTKTVKMYTLHKEIRKSLEKAMYDFLKSGSPKEEYVFNIELHSFKRNKFYEI